MMNLAEMNNELLACRHCPRLVEWRESVAREKRRAYKDWEYWGKPVPGFGDEHAAVFVIGLAPGAHGSNRTGRQFTGDASGDFLFPALFRAGFASQPNAISRGDGMVLFNLYTAPICRCVPPDNKPTADEMANCQQYLELELEIINPKVIVVLGRIAFEGILRIFRVQDPSIKFAHNAIYQIPNGSWVVCSYHPSRQNTQTGRLTGEMFNRVWKTVRQILER
jgi:uracil-DNA glycosylase family 4